ncbi:hypothetical protein ACIP6P_00845 [Streptomyces sp. NPDC088729]
MARTLRMLGTNSKTGECPTLYEDVDSGEVQGYTVDRALLVNFAPKK